MKLDRSGQETPRPLRLDAPPRMPAAARMNTQHGPVGSLTSRRLERVLAGFPQDRISDSVGQSLIRFVLDLDAVGRYDPNGRGPLVDEHSYVLLLGELAGPEWAKTILPILHDLPGAAFRLRNETTPSPVEVPWFALAENVTILDPETQLSFTAIVRTTAFADNDMPGAVRELFPGLELDLLRNDGLPTRLQAAEENGELGYLLVRCVRHLGWWGAIVGALTAASAHLAWSVGIDSEAWPLLMFILGTAVGDWTMTIAAEALFAPVD